RELEKEPTKSKLERYVRLARSKAAFAVSRTLSRMRGTVGGKSCPVRGAMRGTLASGRQQASLLAEVIRGWFQPGLAKLVHRIVARHLRANREFRAHRYPRPKQL